VAKAWAGTESTHAAVVVALAIPVTQLPELT